MTDLTALRVERTYRAPAQAVFDAWTNPAVMRRWWHAGDATWENTAAEADLRPGGRLRVVMRAPDGATTVVLTHAGLSEEAVSGHSDGWQQALANLAPVVER